MTRRSLTWPLLAAIVGALAAVAAFGWPREAAAHAVLERSLPVQNQRLQEPPALVETWYSEPLERSLTSLQVLDTQGDPVHVGATLFSGEDPLYAAIAVPQDLGPGIYTVAYQNVSRVDGHAWTGSFSFIILNPDGSVPAGTAFRPEGLEGGGQGYLPGVGDTTLRWLGLLAAVAMVGAMSFYFLIARPAAQFLEEDDVRRVEDATTALAADLVVIAVPVLIISVIGQLFLLSDRLGGPETVDDILFDTRTGELWIARLGLAVALLLLFLPALVSTAYRAGGRASLVVAVALVGSLGLLITYSLGSHASTGGGEFWGVGSDFVHFAATAAWVGALVQLPLLFWWTRKRLDEHKRLLYLANAFDRFSWLAVISVALLISTGVFNGFVQLPAKEALWETTYGRVLIGKLALILPLLAVAGMNALFVKPRLVAAIDALYDESDGRPGGEARGRLERRLQWLQAALPRTVALEFLLGAAVLASVGILSQTTPAKGELREAAGRPSGQFAASDEAADLKGELSISPFGIGLSTFEVRLEPKAGSQLGEALGVRLRAFFDDPSAPPSAGTGGTDQELSATEEPGVWRAEAALLTQPGDWRVEARIRRRGIDDAVANFSVPQVGGLLARAGEPQGLFDLPFTSLDWNIVAGGAMVTLGVGAFLIWRNRPPTWERATGLSVLAASVVAAAAGVALIVGVPGEETTPRESPIAATQESLAMGRDLFTNNCQICHGAEGRGDGPQAISLAVPPADLSQHVPYHGDGIIFTWISDGIPTKGEPKRMPPFEDELSEEERWHLVNFLREAFGSGEFTPVAPEDLQASAVE